MKYTSHADQIHEAAAKVVIPMSLRADRKYTEGFLAGVKLAIDTITPQRTGSDPRYANVRSN